MSATPYHISVPDEAVEKLKSKLADTIFPDSLEGDDVWKYGAPLSDVKSLATYWKDGFDWRAAEAKINELPNYKAPIAVDGFGSLDIHFVHQPSPVQRAIPLLFVHGCKFYRVMICTISDLL